MTIFNGKFHYKWQFSIAMLNYQRVEYDWIWSAWQSPEAILHISLMRSKYSWHMRDQNKQIRDSTVMSGGFAVSEKGPALGKVASGAKCLTIIITFVGSTQQSFAERSPMGARARTGPRLRGDAWTTHTGWGPTDMDFKDYPLVN